MLCPKLINPFAVKLLSNAGELRSRCSRSCSEAIWQCLFVSHGLGWIQAKLEHLYHVHIKSNFFLFSIHYMFVTALLISSVFCLHLCKFIFAFILFLPLRYFVHKFCSNVTVSVLEIKRLPTVLQKNAFEWGFSGVPHSEDAILVTQHVANFFVRLVLDNCKKSICGLHWKFHCCTLQWAMSSIAYALSQQGLLLFLKCPSFF